MVIIDVGGERHSAERNCLLRYPTTRYDWGIDHFVQMIEEMRIDNAFMQIIEIDHQTAGKWKNTTEGNGLFSFLVSTFNHLAMGFKQLTTCPYFNLKLVTFFLLLIDIFF